MAGAILGEVGMSLFVAGATFRENLGDSRSAKCCILPCKMRVHMGRVRSPKRRVRDDGRIIVESSFYSRKQLRDCRRKS